MRVKYFIHANTNIQEGKWENQEILVDKSVEMEILCTVEEKQIPCNRFLGMKLITEAQHS